MISVKAAKKWMDQEIINHLMTKHEHLRIADLGPNAKQSDVTKVKALILEKVNKLWKSNEPNTMSLPTKSSLPEVVALLAQSPNTVKSTESPTTPATSNGKKQAKHGTQKENKTNKV